jgi:hypothetical protein
VPRYRITPVFASLGGICRAVLETRVDRHPWRGPSLLYPDGDVT